jgi:recombination protein RecT
MSDIKTMIRTDAAMKEITASLPAHVNPDRWARTVVTCINKNPKLASTSKASFLSAMMDCSELGLEPNGREAHLIPYGNTCQLIVDYKGLIKLAFQSGTVKSIHAGVVYENDSFDYAECEHLPHGWLPEPKPPERGKCIGAFVIIENKDGSVHKERMTFDEIQNIKNRSRASKSGPWVTDWDEMAKKTVFRRAAKWIQLSPHLQTALEKDWDSLAPINGRGAAPALSPRLADELVAGRLEKPTEGDTEPPVIDIPSEDEFDFDDKGDGGDDS